MYSEVVRALRERGAHFEVLHHPPAPSGVQEAITLGVAADDVVKAVVLETCDGAALAVLPASRRVDMSLVRAATGDPGARLATEAEIAVAIPGCELGAVPPLGSVVHAPAYVDPEVLRHSVVSFAAGTQTESVTGPAEELFSGETVTVACISEPRRDRPRGGV
jgi:Ala-tRNA(Pro) deacylase